MRVTGGSARGVPLVAPRGTATRPTTDRAREAIFSILGSMGAVFDRVLDLYAGTGALAIEALSRDAEHADLVERAPAACTIIRHNLAATRFTERARVHQMDTARFVATISGPYTLIMLDPPYADPAIAVVLAALAASPALDDTTTLVLEHAAKSPPPAQIGPLLLVSDRRYGDTGVAFYTAPDV